MIGAHPDDCELGAGAITARYLEMGHNVTFIVTTNGECGHHQLSKEQIKSRRLGETMDVVSFLGIQYIVMDNPDFSFWPWRLAIDRI